MISQSICLGVEPTLGLVTGYYTYFLSEGCCLKVSVLFLWSALSDERTGLQFTVQSKWFESRRTRNHTLLLSETPPGWRARLPYLCPPGTGSPVIPPGTGFPLRRLLRLVGLKWRYSNPPPTWRARSPYVYPPGTGWSNAKSRFKIILRPTVSQSAYLGVESARI
jgi:hypothetical protein